ncbi:MAG: bifunctional UDP-sugar hydrolase/5'-nucleotidase [Desulfovibrio sp.]
MSTRRFFLAALLVAVLLVIPTGKVVAGSFELTVLHTNDLHAHLAPFNEYGSLCTVQKDAEGQCQGGSARLAAAIAAERAGSPNVILLDAGDQFQGTLFYSRYKGQACAALMNRLDYDAMTLGNHEFDDGPETLAAFLKRLSFPALAANLDATACPVLQGLFRPWILLDLNGRKVGVVGVTHPDIPRISSPGPLLTFADPVPEVVRAVAELRKQGAGIIVCLSHLGLEGDRRLAAGVAGLDVIVGGHSHALLANGDPEAEGPCPLVVRGRDGNPVLIVAAGYWGRYLGVLRVVFDDQGQILTQRGNPRRMDAAAAQQGAVAAEVAHWGEGLLELQGQVIAETRTALDVAACRTGECLPGDLRAEAFLAGAAGQNATAALVNGGSMRNGLAPGPLTLGNMLAMYPFVDEVMAVTLTGADLRAALEHGLSALGGHEGSGRFLQVAGLRYTFDSSRPRGERLRDVWMFGPDGAASPLDVQALYRIALPRFLYRGGDGFTVFAERGQDVFNDGKDLVEVMREFLQRHSPLDRALDGRIRDLASDPNP